MCKIPTRREETTWNNLWILHPTPLRVCYLTSCFISQNIPWSGSNNSRNNEFIFRRVVALRGEVLPVSSETKLALRSGWTSWTVSSKYFHPRLHEAYISGARHAEQPVMYGWGCGCWMFKCLLPYSWSRSPDCSSALWLEEKICGELLGLHATSTRLTASRYFGILYSNTLIIYYRSQQIYICVSAGYKTQRPRRHKEGILSI